MLRLVLMAIVCATTALGCSGSQARPVAVYPVTGKVTYKSQPVVGADITFVNETENRSAFGRTDEKGEFQLTTFSSNDGAVAGKHIVTIVKVVPPPPPANEPAVESAEYVPPGLGESTAPPPPKSDIPGKYANQQTSGLIAVVNAEGANHVEFDLKD